MADADADALLVARAQRGDKRAFEMLVVKYQRRIERLIARMVRDVDLVPDIAQEAFIRAYRALPQFRGEAAFYTWLYRITVNTAKKALVELRRDPLIFESAMPGAGGDDETSRVENEPSDVGTPDALLASALLGLTTLRELQKPGFYDTLADRTRDLVSGLTNAASKAGVPFCGDSEGGMFGFFLLGQLPQNYAAVMTTDSPAFNKFFHAMLDAGVYYAPALYEAGFVSAAHSAEDIEATVDAASRYFSQL